MNKIPLISQPELGHLPQGLFHALDCRLLDRGAPGALDSALLLPEAGRVLLEYFAYGDPAWDGNRPGQEPLARVERLAALIGKPYHWGTGHCYLVERVLPIPCAHATGSAVQAQPGEWGAPVRNAIRECNQERPQPAWSYLLGTAHSHPGFGVFLSGVDRRNHRSMDVELGLSLVLDPVAGEMGGYTLRGRRFRRCPIHLAEHNWQGIRVL